MSSSCRFVEANRRRLFPPVFLLPILLAGCTPDEPPEEPLRPVRSEEVHASKGSRVRRFSGTARAGQETELSFRVAGKIQEFAVNVGDEVRGGDLIARLEPKDYELEVARAQALLDQARAASRNADANLDRVRGLWENGNASQNDLDASLAQAQSARAQVDSAGKALEQARRRLGYARLRAPMEGAIAEVRAEVNENVQQGQTVVVVTSGARLEVRVAMPEQFIAQVREGASVDVGFDTLPEAVFEAVVTEVGVASTGTSTTFPVIVRLASPREEIRPGMAAEVAFRFESADGKDRFYLRPEAVGEDRDGRFVFVLERGSAPGVGIVRRTPVEVGSLTPDGLEILSGLADGQEVVTAGVRRLTDGQPVKLPDRGSS